MDQTELINKAARLINKASERTSLGFRDQAEAHLVELRELLNNELELEAGGTTERPTQPPPCGG